MADHSFGIVRHERVHSYGALAFIDTSRYIIRDINYHIWLQRHVSVHGPIKPDSDSDSN